MLAHVMKFFMPAIVVKNWPTHHVSKATKRLRHSISSRRVRSTLKSLFALKMHPYQQLRCLSHPIASSIPETSAPRKVTTATVIPDLRRQLHSQIFFYVHNVSRPPSCVVMDRGNFFCIQFLQSIASNHGHYNINTWRSCGYGDHHVPSTSRHRDQLSINGPFPPTRRRLLDLFSSN